MKFGAHTSLPTTAAPNRMKRRRRNLATVASLLLLAATAALWAIADMGMIRLRRELTEAGLQRTDRTVAGVWARNGSIGVAWFRPAAVRLEGPAYHWNYSDYGASPALNRWNGALRDKRSRDWAASLPDALGVTGTRAPMVQRDLVTSRLWYAGDLTRIGARFRTLLILFTLLPAIRATAWAVRATRAAVADARAARRERHRGFAVIRPNESAPTARGPANEA